MYVKIKTPDLLIDIVKQLETKGYARYDFGVFRVFKRGGSKRRYPKGKLQGQIFEIKPYKAVFFRASRPLQEIVKTLNDNVVTPSKICRKKKRKQENLGLPYLTQGEYRQPNIILGPLQTLNSKN